MNSSTVNSLRSEHLQPGMLAKERNFEAFVLTYLIITGCYDFLYVPVVIGLHIKMGMRVLWVVGKGVADSVYDSEGLEDRSSHRESDFLPGS